MDEVWKGLLTCDYEHTRPGSTALELDLYTTSLTRWPLVFMDDPRPYGRLRRAGIVDIPEPDHLALTGRWHHLLADPAYATAMVTAAEQRHRRTDAALLALEHQLDNGEAPERHLAGATEAFLGVMSAHIVNWLLPDDQWQKLLAGLLGSDADGRSCRLALNTPDATGHLLDAHLVLLDGAAALAEGTDLATAAGTLAARAGTLYGDGSPAAAAMPLEDRTRADGLLTAAATDTDGQRDRIDASRRRAVQLRDAWALASQLAAAGNPTATARVEALTCVCRWAAGSEESRKVHRHRFLAAARRWCQLAAADPVTITTADLLNSGSVR
ncbi:hypothetical protein [Kitasatospora sp. DSM 101779]|uniref:hypothetical protein n=1 Tax=Kitasatospora sp. DSM 101779 TaxID=2853165 RepID=UPI0021D9B8E8|nr:hypothetical protein [Kitasatospora sp. DSM 101779]MCU7827270.1 hypothetical protein [Kitasatospora sp. DSM 101779]